MMERIWAPCRLGASYRAGLLHSWMNTTQISCTCGEGQQPQVVGDVLQQVSPSLQLLCLSHGTSWSATWRPASMWRAAGSFGNQDITDSPLTQEALCSSHLYWAGQQWFPSGQHTAWTGSETGSGTDFFFYWSETDLVCRTEFKQMLFFFASGVFSGKYNIVI